MKTQNPQRLIRTQETRESPDPICAASLTLYFISQLCFSLRLRFKKKKKEKERKRKKKWEINPLSGLKQRSSEWQRTGVLVPWGQPAIQSFTHGRKTRTEECVWVGTAPLWYLLLSSGSLLDTSNGRASSLAFDASDWSRGKTLWPRPLPPKRCVLKDNYVIFTICVDLTADLLYLFILKIKVHLFSLCCGSVIYLKQLVQNYNMKKLIIMDIFNVLSPLSLRSLRNDDALSFLTNILAPLKVCRIIYSQFLFVMNQLKYRQLSLSYYDTWWKLKHNGILRQVLPIYKKICMTFCMLPIRQHMIITYIHPWIYLYIGL